MMRVMIVDDEKLIRDGLARLIDWKAYGCTVVAEAADGVQALEYLQDHEIELVFTDIRMPRLDGMEFAQQLRNNWPAVRIVFISGYDDFTLVRKALQMGACDYLLKPLDPDVLKELLTRLNRDVEGQAKLSQEELKRLNRDAGIARQHRIQKLFRRIALDPKRPLSQEEIALLEPDSEMAYRLIVVEISQFYKRYASLNAEQLGLKQDSLSEELQEMCGEDTIVFTLGDGRFGLCLYGPEDDIKARGDALMGKLFHLPRTGDALVCYDGGQTRRPDGIAGLYANALIERENRFSPTDAGSRVQGSWRIDDKLDRASNEVLEAVRLGDKGLLSRQINEMKAVIGSEGEHTFLYAQVAYANLYAQAIRCISDAGGSISEVFDDPMGEYRSVYNGQNLDAASDNMLRILDAIAEYMRMSRSGDTTTQIRKAKRFIDNHLGDSSLNMQQVADEFAMSASYFSTEFRKTVGYTFTEYLMMARIQRAGELLRHSQLKIYEVAEMLGYENTTYFSTLFKRRYGVTPKQYRGEN